MLCVALSRHFSSAPGYLSGSWPAIGVVIDIVAVIFVVSDVSATGVVVVVGAVNDVLCPPLYLVQKFEVTSAIQVSGAYFMIDPVLAL